MSPDLQPGYRFEWSYTVPARATVPQLYHDTDFCLDMPDVLATGYMVGMMELACVHGIMPFTDWPREQSVGTMVHFSHFAPTPPGMTLAIKGEVLEVAGRRVLFRIEAWDGVDRICEGTHERHVIDPARFNARVAAKLATGAGTGIGAA
ncbi:thioesterase family protein [Massilia sp. CCM 9210]|uniref:thioesterase family protein n=1 Tax=Massilia scottii TaxID=3057166 RepID=UPI00279657A6|nr:thioesterase family protein [Massilia sp. CCM 9210]MDQ1815124.1 thioesterase family protein [Massilia sp. CCM 9210]